MVDKTVEENIGTITEMIAMIDRIARKIIVTALGMTVMVEAGTGLEKDHFLETMATILEIKVEIGIEFDVISVGNMIILQGTVPLLGKRKR